MQCFVRREPILGPSLAHVLDMDMDMARLFIAILIHVPVFLTGHASAQAQSRSFPCRGTGPERSTLTVVTLLAAGMPNQRRRASQAGNVALAIAASLPPVTAVTTKARVPQAARRQMLIVNTA